MLVVKNGLYLSRTAREVGIVRDRGANEFWRWVTTEGYYVTADGRACIGGECSQDLVREITPCQAQTDAVDSIMGSDFS